MSVNWVMLDHDRQGFVSLPNEKVIFQSPPRTALSLQSGNKYPGHQPYSVSSGSGILYLTNQRIVYIPATSTPQLQSFSAPLLNLHDTHVAAPFFGPNIWVADLQPVAGGGIPPTHAAIEVKFTFKEGGAFDFHSQFERIKERLAQAVQNARERGLMTGDGEDIGTGRGAGPLAAVNLANVHLDELPAYEGPGVPGSIMPPTSTSQAESQPPPRPDPPESPTSTGQNNVSDIPQIPPPASDVAEPPTGPPPGYEEVQQQSVADELEQRLRSASRDE